MVTMPLYAARVEDLIADRLISTRCHACDHLANIPSAAIKARLSPHEFIKNIPGKFRCQQCGTKGNVTLIVGHALGYADPEVSVSPAG